MPTEFANIDSKDGSCFAVNDFQFDRFAFEGEVIDSFRDRVIVQVQFFAGSLLESADDYN